MTTRSARTVSTSALTMKPCEAESERLIMIVAVGMVRLTDQVKLQHDNQQLLIRDLESPRMEGQQWRNDMRGLRLAAIWWQSTGPCGADGLGRLGFPRGSIGVLRSGRRLMAFGLYHNAEQRVIHIV